MIVAEHTVVVQKLGVKYCERFTSVKCLACGKPGIWLNPTATTIARFAHPFTLKNINGEGATLTWEKVCTKSYRVRKAVEA